MYCRYFKSKIRKKIILRICFCFQAMFNLKCLSFQAFLIFIGMNIRILFAYMKSRDTELIKQI